jgi:hypothetical protein
MIRVSQHVAAFRGDMEQNTHRPWKKWSILLLVVACICGCASTNTDDGTERDDTQSETVFSRCAPLAAPSGSTVRVTTARELVEAVAAVDSGMTILVADGVYALNGAYLRIEVPNVTLRSENGGRDAVILDGGYATTEIVQIVASNVTVADLTLRRAYDHAIHVTSTTGADTDGVRIHNVRIVDPGQQAIKINPTDDSHFTDDGVVECCLIEMTDSGRTHVRDDCYTGGVDAHRSRGWIVRDNVIGGFYCGSGLSEHAVHFWRGSRGTIVERNVLRENARAIGLGLEADGQGRTYPDNPCPGVSSADHYGGIVRNNFVLASRAALFGSEYGFDCGICLWQACSAAVLHNTVFSADAAFSSIEWRFAGTRTDIAGNLVSHAMRERDGARATLRDNVTDAGADLFVDAASGDLHLAGGAASAIDRVTPDGRAVEDIDGDPRPQGAAADAGADEYLSR